MRLLLIDMLRRHKLLQLMGVAMVAGIWWMVGAEDDPTVASAAIGACVCGAYLVAAPRIAMMAPTALSYLPVSRRDVWRATWLASTIWPTLMVTVTVLTVMILAPATRHTLGFSPVGLSAVYAFVYTGFSFGALKLLRAAGSRTRVWRRLGGSLEPVMPLASLGVFWAGLWLSRRVPVPWSAFSQREAWGLAAAVALVVAIYFHSPRPTANPPLRAGNLRRAAERGATRSVPPSRLTGVPRLLWNESMWTLLLAGLGVALLAAAVAVDRVLFTRHVVTEVVRNQLTHLFHRGGAASQNQFGYLFWLVAFFFCSAARFGSMIRHLRVLPLRPGQLNAVLVAWPAAVMLASWALLLVVYIVVVRQPVTSLSLGLMLSIAGLSALARSFLLRWDKLLMVVFLLACASSILSEMRLPGPPSVFLVAAGVAGLIAAALLNQSTLLRNATYKRPRIAIGLPPPR